MRALLLVTVVACSSAERRAGPAAPPASEALRDAIERGDLAQTQAALCAAYAARGMECAEPLRAAQLAADDVMSRYDEVEYTVKMQPMPAAGGGFAYWDNWSAKLSAGAWQPRALFADDDEARRVANLLLATVLAHELGHHLSYMYQCPRSGPANELLADELSVPLMRELATDELGALHDQLLGVTAAMIAAVPEELRVVVPPGADVRAWVAAQEALPADGRSYISLHLSRQRALFAEGESFAASAGAACLGRFREHLATRRLLPSSVRTERRIRRNRGDRPALDADGRLYAAAGFAEDGAIAITPLDGGAPIRVPFDGFGMVDAFAAHSPTRFAITTDAVMLVDASTSPPTTRVIEGLHASALAFDRDGTLYAMQSWREDATWTIVDAATGHTRWNGKQVASLAWLDGPAATAQLDPQRFAIAGDALIAADDRSLRLLDHGEVATLAGGVRGSRDGDSAEAKLFTILAVGALPDGKIRFVEEHGDDWAVRILDQPRAAVRAP